MAVACTTFPLGVALRAISDDDVCFLALDLPAFFADIERILSFDTAGAMRIASPDERAALRVLADQVMVWERTNREPRQRPRTSLTNPEG